jgi:hypothetical protein
VVGVVIDVEEMGCGGVEWIDLAQGHLTGSCKHDKEPSGSIKCAVFFITLRGPAGF